MAAGGLLIALAVLGALLSNDGPGELAASSDASATPVEPTPTAATGPTEAPQSEPQTSVQSGSPDSNASVNGAEVFLTKLSAALREDDRTFLIERLHPAVLERYGEESCRDYLAGVIDPEFELAVRGVGDAEAWQWQSDGLTTTIDEATRVEVERAVQGQTIIQEMHLASVDGQLRWFTDCGNPSEHGG